MGEDYALSASTTFSSYILGATKVYDDDDFTTTETGWKTMEFSENFTHRGGNALLVAVRGEGCTTSGGCSRYCRYTSETGTHWYKHADTNDPGQNATGSLDANRSNIQLAITTSQATCPRPTSLQAVVANESNATLTWVDNSGLSWQVACFTDANANPNNYIVGTANTTTYTQSGLTIDTDY